MVDVLCLGTLTGCDIIFSGLSEMPKEGTEVFCRNLDVKPGGSANTPVALAKLGVSTALLTRLGNDLFGRIVFDSIKASGVDMAEVIVDNDYRTCVSGVLSVNGNRGFATYYDNSRKIPEQRIESAIMNCRVVFSDIGTCLELGRILEYVKKYHKKLLIDTGWMGNMELKRFAHVLDAAEVFSPNEEEARAITGKENVEEALAVLAGHVKIAIIKRGRNGAVARSGGSVFSAPARTEFPEVDTTGAGDIFNAGFLYGYLKGWDIGRCLQMANLTGGFSIGFAGGVDDSFTLQNLKKYIDRI